jgi:predicted cupin superfamily sugar epimerase
MARATPLLTVVFLTLLTFVHGALCAKPIGTRKASDVVAQLGLAPNPEKGYFKETFRDTLLINNGTRSASTAIYYLLEGSAGLSAWHRIDSVEVWHWYAGDPLTLSLSLNDGSGVRNVVLGPDVFSGQSPQIVIRSWEWQAARSQGSWTLVGTTGEFDLCFLGQSCADTMACLPSRSGF